MAQKRSKVNKNSTIFISLYIILILGCWDSIHVVEVTEKSSGRSAHYKLTSTSMLWLQTNKVGSGTMNLGGSLTRQIEQDSPVSEASPHIANIGKMIEEMENKIR